MMFAILLSLLWFVKLPSCARDLTVPVLCGGLIGASGYFGALVLLFRLRKRLRGEIVTPTLP